MTKDQELQLGNLLAQGVKMADAKRKLGIKKKVKPGTSPNNSANKPK